ncbi:magnesium transporter [Saccharopolyspora rhizosphaerae]|uniref:Magnesium transporter n=1 Tax=Saccharopolyspora rhizosphaerae TaxID=2492662 RepID=A0A3R8Q7I2_9PSEU|nr:magnesium transporter [Saccharopolyspora rhizosphaerae]RRO18644.1 magnesium transporter [Saccharopolyspora rhizosphaerae]
MAQAEPEPVTANRDSLGIAEHHASADVPIAAPGDSVDEVFAGLRGRRFDSAAVVAVCDDDRLLGLATVERLLAAPAGVRVSEVMDHHPPVVAPGTDQERAAWEAVRHREPGLAVVGPQGRFLGLIPPHRLLSVLLQEHDQDMARLGGFLASSESARSASTEGVGHRLWHRLPWLLVGLAGALVAALIVGAFERQLEHEVLIAFFVPGVVYLADAIGTQTEALIIRGLSVGISVSRVVFREFLTGAVLGLLLAGSALPLVVLIWGDVTVAVAVAVALFAASATSTFVAMALPWLFHRLGVDPAFGSGPLATVVQDLLSVSIYFGVATVVVT